MGEQISLREEVDRMVDREPFIPFTIVMASGDRFEVVDPHQIATGENVIIILPRQAPHVFIRWNQVSSVEVNDLVR